MVSREEMLEHFYQYLDETGHLALYESDFVSMSDIKLSKLYDEVFVLGMDLEFDNMEIYDAEEDDSLATEEELLMMGHLGEL